MQRSTVQLSITFLRHLTQIQDIPGFSPYLWSIPKNIFPFQAIAIILIYLKRSPRSQTAQIARDVVDEVIALIESAASDSWFMPKDALGTPHDLDSERSPATWRLLRTLRAELKSTMPETFIQNGTSDGMTPPSGSRVHPTPGLNSSHNLPKRAMYLERNGGTGPLPSGSVSGEQTPGFDPEISDLNLWSSVVEQDSEDMLRSADMQ